MQAATKRYTAVRMSDRDPLHRPPRRIPADGFGTRSGANSTRNSLSSKMPRKLLKTLGRTSADPEHPGASFVRCSVRPFFAPPILFGLNQSAHETR